MVDLYRIGPVRAPQDNNRSKEATANERRIATDFVPRQRAWDGVDRRRQPERRLRRSARPDVLEMRRGRDRRGSKGLSVKV